MTATYRDGRGVERCADCEWPAEHCQCRCDRCDHPLDECECVEEVLAL